LESVVLSSSLALSEALIPALGLQRARAMLLRNGDIEGPCDNVERPTLAVLIEADAVVASAVIRNLGAWWPGVCIIVVGIPNEEDAILRCVTAGAAGLVTREESLGDLSRALEEVLENGRRIPARALPPLLDRLVALSTQQLPGRPAHVCRLSVREIDVISRMARGATNKEIAVQLVIEVQTVKNCVSRLLRKLGVHSRYDAARVWGGAVGLADQRAVSTLEAEPGDAQEPRPRGPAV
jgi:DNA-binding NarL/FixJ family response regulator